MNFQCEAGKYFPIIYNCTELLLCKHALQCVIDYTLLETCAGSPCCQHSVYSTLGLMEGKWWSHVLARDPQQLPVHWSQWEWKRCPAEWASGPSLWQESGKWQQFSHFKLQLFHEQKSPQPTEMVVWLPSSWNSKQNTSHFFTRQTVLFRMLSRWTESRKPLTLWTGSWYCLNFMPLRAPHLWAFNAFHQLY
jgi:hypothetical protein